MSADPENPYQLSPEKTIDPPTNFGGTLRFLGPGFILSASIVGSGELIATTILGARAGFVCLWVVIFSCLVKVAVQLEFGKYAIYSGRTTMEAFNRLPGPRLGRASWSIWTWLLLMSLKFLQVGGIVGGVVLIFVQMFPLAEPASFTVGSRSIPLDQLGWAALVVVTVALLIFRGYYRPIERWCLLLIGLFTIFTIVSVIALQWTPNAMTAAEFRSGFGIVNVPAEAVFFALAVFGITGVGGDEIMAYNYWLIEKGYAAHTGPDDGSEAWRRRARGWIRVMRLDALCALACYTIVTALFYVLGAAVLHRQGLVPEKSELVSTLAKMYTDTLGPWAEWVFLVGALVVLYSTLLAALAAWSRLYSDAFAQIGVGSFHDPAGRRRGIALCAWLFPTIWAVLFFVFSKPGWMVIVGGVVTTVILAIVLFAALVMRYRWLPGHLRPTRLYDIILWLSAIAIAGVAIYTVYNEVYRPVFAPAGA